MDNLTFNNKNNKSRYSIIIYNIILKNIILTLDNLKKMSSTLSPENNDFEIIIISQDKEDNTFNLSIFNNYEFKIIYVNVNQNYNINKYYNYSISLSTGDIIIFQNSECFHYDSIFEIIKNYNFINYIYTASIVNLTSENENNFILNTNNNQNNISNSLNKYSKDYKVNLKSNNNNISYFLIIHRKNLDIINGFDESENNLNFNNLYNRITNICSLKCISSRIFVYYCIKTINLREILNNSKNDNLNDNLNDTTSFYKRREYKTGIAITLFSDRQTPKGRIEASKIFINSLIENIKTTPIIFLIDHDIIQDHYDYLIEKVNNSSNITIYKNILNYGISKSKNICIKLLEEMNIDYICLLDDDILIKKDFTEYIKNILDNINIPILANADKKHINKNKVINNFNFNLTKPLFYYGNFMCINRYYIEIYGYNILFPYKYGLEHIELTERYLSDSKYRYHCIKLDDYFDDRIIVDNVSQFAVHTIIINNKRIKDNQRIMNSALRNIKYISFNFNESEIIKIIV
jgi:hypothetical protein